MKVLAIIPARAGSKGIPNKNVRIINGKPLIYYSINNAKLSKFITDIIVTTDSNLVKSFAKQMNVQVRDRDKKLCGDDITLDSVIYDAIPKDKDWDYIVTMQPTSPTLKAETLDKAIQYAIDNNLDTVISAINKPHLSWKEEKGIKVPNYIERLNRQYLPPCYMETGAFVISKNKVVTEKTRIGKKVDVYEISEDESQDIDDFSDLQNVINTLNKTKIAMYVNGNNLIGTGHIYRVLELADEFYSKPDIFYNTNITNKKIFGDTTHNLIPISSINEMLKICKEKKYSIFINDILSTSNEYMEQLINAIPEAKIINFEDDGEGARYANVVFNALYNKKDYINVKAGEKYYIAGKSFLFCNPITINEKVKNIMITFGGADPQNYTDRLLNIINKEKYKDYNFIVVLGKAKQNIQNLMKFSKSNIQIYYDVNNMAELMVNADIAITSRGRTGYELAILGIPSISMAQNFREEKHGFMCEKNGFSYLGLNPDNDIIENELDKYINLSQIERVKLQNKLLSHDLKNGRKRIMNIISDL